VRALSQIGGAEAKPAVDFMIAALPQATEVDGYNVMVYLALLGPDAADAADVLARTRIKNPVLPSATLWAIQCDRNLPWEMGRFPMAGPGGLGVAADDARGDFPRFIYEAYIHELGERLAPAAKLLAGRIVDGTAGNVPVWGYEILTAAPKESIELLAPRLADDTQVSRERSAVALGYMGPAAAPAKPQVAAAVDKAADEREKRLLKWCLREICPSRKLRPP
jgi:hypothetical protein